MQVEANEDFLGRLWVPVTLALIAIVVAISLAASMIMLGFALAATTAAMSITLRLTWDRRDAKAYAPIVLAILLAHLGLVALLSPSLSRASGGVYMIAALLDAVLMTTIIRSLTRSRH